MPWLRTLLVASFALCYFGLSLVAGLYSSNVLRGPNDEVLVHSPYCGSWKTGAQQPSLAEIAEQDAAAGTYANAVIASSTGYARRCYRHIGLSPPDCDFYSSASIPWKTDFNASCPFEASICVPKSQAVRMDTGLLDANVLFGINTAASDAVQLRKLTTCAPLPLSNHVESLDQTTIAELAPDLPLVSGDSFFAYNYGHITAPEYPWTWLGHTMKFNNTPFYTLE